MQLLRPGVKVALIKKGYSEYDIYTDERFIEEYGITPFQYIDKKAFTGDTADGYPGVKGIGPKTALTLIKQYGSIEGILEALDELTPARRKRIEEGIDMLHLSRKLAEIHCDLDVYLSNRRPEHFRFMIVEKRSLFEKEGYTMIMRHADSLFS